MNTVFLVGHDNYGSREIFTRIYEENNSQETEFVLLITQGLYYKKSFLQSILKLLREASFLFCLHRFIEGILYKLKGDTLYKRAVQRNVQVYEVDDINSVEAHALFDKHKADLMVSMFTMHIYSSKTIEKARLGSIGTHPSILPQYRGLEVFFWMLSNDEKEGGVSVFTLSPQIDVGKVFLQEKFGIAIDESITSIYEKLTSITARLVSQAVPLILAEENLTYIEGQGPSRYFPMPTRESFRRFLRTNHKLVGRPKKGLKV